MTLLALVGRPNSGKSSVFNTLTGGDAHVGNFPGITVDILEGKASLPDGKDATVCDLPGLYSIAAVVDHDTDEGVARAFLDARKDSADFALLQILDGTQLELGLGLTRELLREGHRLAVVVTQRDLVETDGATLDVELLERELGVPVGYVTGRDPRSKKEILALAARAIESPRRESSAIEPKEVAAKVHKAAESAPNAVTDRIDGILLHPVIGPFTFVALMALVFAAVFLVADPMTGAMDYLVGAARSWLVSRFGNGLVASFVADGLLGGAGTVVAFMPQIVILTIAMHVLEATGYLARGAFLTDRLLRLLGLSGRSFLPLLMGHACAIPAIGSTRIIRDPKERLTTILVLPLMTCSARLPTYSLLLSTFFAERSALFRASLFVGLYFSGILSGLTASLVLRRTTTRGKSLPLVLEMPAYRRPQAALVLRKARQAGSRFLRDVGTTIVIASAILWVLLRVPAPGVTREPEAPPIESSIAATIGRAAEPVTKPAGFDWRINVGLIGSFGARELMVGTLGVIFGVEGADEEPAPLREKLAGAKAANGEPLYTARTSLALLVFFVIACQCMSTIAAIRRETKSLRWPAFVLGYTYGVAYLLAVLVYQGAGLLGMR